MYIPIEKRLKQLNFERDMQDRDSKSLQICLVVGNLLSLSCMMPLSKFNRIKDFPMGMYINFFFYFRYC